MLTKTSNPTGTAATLILSLADPHIKNSCRILSQEPEKCEFDYHIWKNSNSNGESLYKNGHRLCGHTARSYKGIENQSHPKKNVEIFLLWPLNYFASYSRNWFFFKLSRDKLAFAWIMVHILDGNQYNCASKEQFKLF